MNKEINFVLLLGPVMVGLGDWGLGMLPKLDLNVYLILG